MNTRHIKKSAAQSRKHNWGETTILHTIGNVETRLLLIRPGERTSHHAHQIRTELQIPIFGITAIVEPGAKMIELPGGLKAYLIPPGVFHQFIAANHGPGIVLSIVFGRVENDRLYEGDRPSVSGIQMRPTYG